MLDKGHQLIHVNCAITGCNFDDHPLPHLQCYAPSSFSPLPQPSFPKKIICVSPCPSSILPLPCTEIVWIIFMFERDGENISGFRFRVQWNLKGEFGENVQWKQNVDLSAASSRNETQTFY